MAASVNIHQTSAVKLGALIKDMPNECILRVRRSSLVWEGSNRPLVVESDASSTRAFRTASITKTFTAALVFLLIEDGLLALDDCLRKHLPDQTYNRIHILNGTSFGKDITLRQLLLHRSGIFDYASSPGFFKQVISNPNKVWHPQELLDQAIQNGEPYFNPDKAVCYSDTGYVLLAMVIESVTGKSLASAYRQRIFRPLGMEHTYLEGKEPRPTWPVSHAFAGEVDTFDFHPSFDTFGGGGLVATSRDLDTFITCLMHGGVFRNELTLHYMMQGTQSEPGSGTRKLRTSAGISAFSLAGRTVWGHLGHWNSFMLHDIDEDISICGTFNQSKEDQLQKLVLESAMYEALSWPTNM